MSLDGITIGAIAVALTLITGIWKGFDFLQNKMEASIGRVVTEKIKPLEEKIDNLDRKVEDVDVNSTKDFLVARFGEIEAQKGTDEITRQRIYEEMAHYEELGGNNYIHARFEQLKKEGYL